jgi:mannose-6-phosphate isomerase-like protein (cupin superfamily)
MKTHIKSSEINWKASKIKGFSTKQLLELPQGGFKMIRVAPKFSYPLHLHPDKTEFIFVLNGSVKIINGEDSLQGNENDFFALPCNIKHSIVNPFDKDCILLVGAIKN